MKFRCTVTMDLDMPKELDADGASATFVGFVCGMLVNCWQNNPFIKDFKFVSASADEAPND
jgi:hypothetical protein